MAVGQLSTRKSSRVNDWVSRAHDWLLPPNCVLCGGRGAGGADLCRECANELPYARTACRCCAIPLPQEGVCGKCQKIPPSFDDARAVFLYREPVDHLIHVLKFNQKLYSARLLGDLMAEHLASMQPPDVIVPVPLHSGRLRQRGFNQALELARPISKALGVPLALRLCTRQLDTAPQTGMDAKSRRRNLKGAFAVSEVLDALHVAIVDDVMTTGSTVEILAQILKRAGAMHFSVWLCARVDLRGI